MKFCSILQNNAMCTQDIHYACSTCSLFSISCSLFCLLCGAPKFGLWLNEILTLFTRDLHIRSACFRHYVVKGPEKTPYEGGFYHGKLIFPGEFPFQPPSIYMTTPNGRFKVNTRLCLSISDFHPDTWNPAWSVSTILTGLLSFMVKSLRYFASISQISFD